MRRKFKLFPIILLLILITGCGSTETDTAAQEGETEVDINKIEISFDYTRMSTHASNQIAVWVEDESGQLIKTIYVSDFTAARRGYENREDALNHWALAANPAAMSDDEVDAISSATPQAGSQSFEWDLKDERGNRVPDGRYFIKLEGTLYWSSNVLYMGEIVFPGTVPGELDIQIERSEPENTENVNMIQNVRMTAYDRD